MKKCLFAKMVLLLFSFCFLIPLISSSVMAASATKQRIYDEAGLLTEQETEQLEALAEEYSVKRETDFIILTTKDTKGKDIIPYMEDFYDEKGLGYDQKHGNTAILTVDMQHRDLYLAGFYKAEKLLDDHRLDLIRDKITPAMSNKDYFTAFQTFILTADEYMGIRFGLSPNNLLFQLWFQALVAVGLGAVIVGGMAYTSGGRVTINNKTYEDLDTSRVLRRKDQYIRTRTTKRRKPQNNSSGSSGGGGRTSGGHSHSGSRGSF
ncbi:TPM domain-containing protein [Lederbergia sp. NSJ-179]|uniref:TPM domain-containing protein n=1 Tax=Lederbergia sp. NSJ-179 TaxID=2931402 RepID=UPI001FD2B93C|nr:TPM domain-containing protein [Lederbergia sp. NSJ-179]MCJ7841994.1 TPM domain-containing protein [Lederbergia sp. NSJ-179]